MKFEARPYMEQDDGDDFGGGRGFEGDDLGRRRRGGKRRPDFVTGPDFTFEYKDPQQLKHFLTDRGKVVPRRISGLTAKQQRQLTVAIRRSRNIALLPFTTIR